MFLSRGARLEGAQIAALARFWILLSRVEPILAIFEFANHPEPHIN
jgi:hypothetical protein